MGSGSEIAYLRASCECRFLDYLQIRNTCWFCNVFFCCMLCFKCEFRWRVLWRLMTRCVLSAAATGGHDEMRGEHRSQLSLSLAGDGCLRLWTLPEGHRVVHPQGEVRQGPPLWILSRLTGFCAPAPLH